MLNIYKASAGSGKTHTLTGEYITTLFRSAVAYPYKHVLAVTFTNKATDEMKQRIMEELFNLSYPDKKSPYLNDLIKVEIENDNDWRKERENMAKWEGRVRSKAKRLLIQILHDYSAFRISTIDQFFQVIMRSFAREMGKMSTYNVELDSDSVLLFAVDKLFADLDDEENYRLLEQLKNFAIESANDGNQWNIKVPMLALGKVLFNDDFKRFISGESALPGSDDIEKLKAYLLGIKDGFAKELTILGAEALDIFNRFGLTPNDMKGGSKSNFKKLEVFASGKVVDPSKMTKFLALPDNFDEWYAGKKPPVEILAIYNGGLKEKIEEICKVYESGIEAYCTAELVYPNLNTIAVLGEIYKRVLEYCRENNIMLLSESTQLLNKIIDGSDTPFVYEKIGTSIYNYMLDEFQDTSSLQWKNFYPLLGDSLSGGNYNLIVGDVKQSIYRWRGSDWNILNKKLGSSFRKSLMSEHNLEYNWRSGSNIINFNNVFFKECASLMQDTFNERVSKSGLSMPGGEEAEITGIYSNFEQKVPENSRKEGYVEVDIVDGNNVAEFKANACNLLIARIGELVEMGVPQSDMAVLVRGKDEGAFITAKLVENGYSVISADLLKIGTSKLVQRIVNILRDVARPDDPKRALYDIFYPKGIYDAQKLDSIKEFTLYNMCEEIIRVFLTPDEKSDITFIQSFLDIVEEFTDKYGTNIKQFIKWWDETGCTKSIVLPEGINAVTVMTIHKSKGLGFNIVFVPFFSFSVQPKSENFWANMKGYPYYGGPVTIPFKEAASQTVFWNEYYTEYLNKYIDNINIAYVALTRPKNGLYVFTSKGEKVNKDGTVRENDKMDSPGAIMCNFFKYNRLAYELGSATAVANMVVEENCMSIGSKDCLVAADCDGAVETDYSVPVVLEKPINMNRLRTTLKTGSISDEVGIREEGIIMHNIFSQINTRNDIPAACEASAYLAVIKKTPQELEAMVHEKLDGVEEYKWFEEGCKVLNERSIITGKGNAFRPDRVVIKDNGTTQSVVVVDYKFGEYNPGSGTYKHYVSQVKQYMSLLRQMGYEDVSGYLWFVMANKVESVQ